MNGVSQGFLLGDLQLKNNVFFAPLAGCSDYSFRKISKRFYPGLVFCEMVKAEALIRHDFGTYRLLDYSEDMHPIGAQICSSSPMNAKKAAKLIESLGFDVLDLNCGCPVDKVTKDGSGSAMLKDPELIGEVLSEMISSVNIPVTLKVRAGWDKANINIEKIVRIAIKAGAKIITVHGRTREQGYKGKANWDYVKRAKVEAQGKILVFGNGDIFSAQEAINMFDQTGCDGVVISRGTFGQPWITEDLLKIAACLDVKKRQTVDIMQMMLTHLQTIQLYQKEKKALLDMRRVGCWYLKRCEKTKELRIQLNHAQSTHKAMGIIQRAMQ